MKNKKKPTVSIGAAAEKLGVHRTTIYRWLRHKHAPKSMNMKSFEKLMKSRIQDARYKK